MKRAAFITKDYYIKARNKKMSVRNERDLNIYDFNNQRPHER